MQAPSLPIPVTASASSPRPRLVSVASSLDSECSPVNRRLHTSQTVFNLATLDESLSLLPLNDDDSLPPAPPASPRTSPGDSPRAATAPAEEEQTPSVGSFVSSLPLGSKVGAAGLVFCGLSVGLMVSAHGVPLGAAWAGLTVVSFFGSLKMLFSAATSTLEHLAPVDEEAQTVATSAAAAAPLVSQEEAQQSAVATPQPPIHEDPETPVLAKAEVRVGETTLTVRTWWLLSSVGSSLNRRAAEVGIEQARKWVDQYREQRACRKISVPSCKTQLAQLLTEFSRPCCGAGQCAVCLEEEEAPMTLVQLVRFQLACGHSFHSDCVTAWFTSSGKLQCPMCREDMSAHCSDSHATPPLSEEEYQSLLASIYVRSVKVYRNEAEDSDA